LANVQEVLTAQTLITRPDFSVATWDCTGEHADWSEPERPVDGRFVLVRSGCFRRRGSGGAVEHDATLGYLGAPGEPEHFAIRTAAIRVRRYSSTPKAGGNSPASPSGSGPRPSMWTPVSNWRIGGS